MKRILNNKGSTWVMVMIAALVLATALIFFASLSNAATRACITKDGYVMALSKSVLEKAITYVSQEDQAAFTKLFDQNQIFQLKAGVEVYVMDRTWDGMVKIRPAGQTATGWTVQEAIRCE